MYTDVLEHSTIRCAAAQQTAMRCSTVLYIVLQHSALRFAAAQRTAMYCSTAQDYVLQYTHYDVLQHSTL